MYAEICPDFVFVPYFSAKCTNSQVVGFLENSLSLSISCDRSRVLLHHAHQSGPENKKKMMMIIISHISRTIG